MTSGNGRTVRYTTFDKPDQIIRGDYQIDLVYGPDQKRVRRIDQGPTGTSTTYYQSGIYEKVVSDTGKIQHKHYIADVAIITKTENAGSEDGTKTNYFHRDHLDSLTAITDQNGQVIERFSYDPWGKRRQTDWQAAIDFTQITSTITKRGFTDHEHLDGVGLIHMNGRVYDPNVGRFLSADPFIQFADNIQSYNRYSYILNNPLNGIDPTGFITEGITKGITNWWNNLWNSGSPENAPIEAYNNGGSESGPADNSYITPLRAEYQPQKELNYGEQIANDVMNHYNRIGRGESNTTDGSDFRNRYTTTPLRRENFGGRGKEGSRQSGINVNKPDAQKRGNMGLFDDRGAEIFDHWLGGSGDPFIRVGGEWGTYMANNHRLSLQIYGALIDDSYTRTQSGIVDITIHGEIQNGYRTGYEMLHGSHSGLGDLRLLGFVSVGNRGRLSYDVTATWNDKIDPNFTYPMDKAAAGVLKIFYSPKNYNIHISWPVQRSFGGE